jgi:hypothetical protein
MGSILAPDQARFQLSGSADFAQTKEKIGKNVENVLELIKDGAGHQPKKRIRVQFYDFRSSLTVP